MPTPSPAEYMLPARPMRELTSREEGVFWAAVINLVVASLAMLATLPFQLYVAIVGSDRSIGGAVIPPMSVSDLLGNGLIWFLALATLIPTMLAVALLCYNFKRKIPQVVSLAIITLIVGSIGSALVIGPSLSLLH